LNAPTPSESSVSTEIRPVLNPITPARRKLSSRARWLLGLSVPLLVASCMGVRALQPLGERTLAAHSALQLDLTRPDALIESAHLARLPRDLLKVPVLRDTLTEEFVFYYEGNADRLGITGALRRIAFEHDLNLRDDLINALLDQPAEVALWRTEDGKLTHALLSIQRGKLAKLLQPLAEMAAPDTQLSKVGELHVDGSAVPVLRLRYLPGRAILLMAYADRLLVLSSAEMLQETAQADSPLGAPEVAELEKLLADGSEFPAHFGLGKRRVEQRITLNSQVLALGYGQFIPQIAGLRVELKRGNWSAHLALNPGAAAPLAFGRLWQSMPMGASACAAAPLSADASAPLFARLSAADLLRSDLGAQLDQPLALCWYGSSRLHTPLLVTHLRDADGAADGALAQSFERMVGAYEEKAQGGRFAVLRRQVGDATVWTRVVGSSYGMYAADSFNEPEALTNSHYFRVSLARRGDTLLFSLDDQLVTQALATLDSRFPSLKEQLPQSGEVPIYLAADSLATLLEKESLASLPADVEALFRNAAESHLLPKLRALGQHKRYALALPTKPQVDQEWTWVPLQWSEL